MMVDLRMEGVYLKELFSINWLCESGLVENINLVVEEYRQSRGLLVGNKHASLDRGMCACILKLCVIQCNDNCLNFHVAVLMSSMLCALSSPSVCVYWALLLWGKVRYPNRSVNTTSSITSH